MKANENVDILVVWGLWVTQGHVIFLIH